MIEGVLKYISEKNIPLCMPGHKSGEGFLKTPQGKLLYNNFIKCDITEVSGVDNLHHAEGIIKESQNLLSNLYKSKKSYFLVNGSTSGNLIMIFSSFNEGDKIIVERNCHKSIFNGIILRKLKPVYIKNKINNKYDAPIVIDMEHFLNIIKKHSDAKGIIITYPNYYGVCMDLEKIINEASKYGMKVLVDSAHGAHFGINEKLPKSAVTLGADMVVMSAHKTLPSLTQTAFLHVNNENDIDKVDFYFSALTSTSPSYMLMCSMDYARYYLQEYGRQDYEKLINISQIYRKKINSIPGMHVLGQEDLNECDKIDLTRYVINLEKGYSGHKLLKYLRDNGVQAEMSDSRNVVLILSPFFDENIFEELYTVLRNCNIKNLKVKYKKMHNHNIPLSMFAPFEVIDKDIIKVKLEEALNKVCAKEIIPYPPGIPLIMMGEIIDENIIKSIKYYIENDITLLGVEDDCLFVVKN